MTINIQSSPYLLVVKMNQQMNEESRIKLRETRRLMMADLEKSMLKGKSPEDSIFYYHSSEDRIVLSHALFWVMTKSLKGKVAKGKNLLLIRQYQEEMLEAYLTEDDYFPDILHYCNILYETLIPITAGVYDIYTDKDARKLAGITMIAAGYAGDMSEDLCNDLLDDIDFHFNKVRCRKIEQMLPQLNKMVEEEIKGFAANM